MLRAQVAARDNRINRIFLSPLVPDFGIGSISSIFWRRAYAWAGYLNKTHHPRDWRSKGRQMSKLAIVATIKAVPGKRDEYLTFLKAHGKRCLATEPGTLQFEILVPQEEADTVMLYEVYASPEAFQTHWNGISIQQMKQEAAGTTGELRGRALQSG
jgi:quinol monooxygenase YgiN